MYSTMRYSEQVESVSLRFSFALKFKKLRMALMISLSIVKQDLISFS